MGDSHQELTANRALLKKLAANSLIQDHIGKKEYYKWKDWNLFSSATTANEILDLYYELILRSEAKADYFCPIPTSGLTLLSRMVKTIDLTPLTYPKGPLFGQSFDFEDRIIPKSRVFIGDLAINTGDSLEGVIPRLKKYKLEIAGVFTIVFNDTFPSRFHPDIMKLLEEGKIHYLITVNQLLEANSSQEY